MSQSCNRIAHDGVVVAVNGDSVSVRIVRTSACVSCKVSGLCNKTESREMDVTVRGAHVSGLKEGDSMARMAVTYGFGLPLAIMLVSFFIAETFCENDLIISLTSLGMVAVYYFILYLLRDRLDKRFSFEIMDIKKI